MEKRFVRSYWEEILFSAFLVVGGVLCVLFSGWDDWWRLETRGITVTAEVLRIEKEYRQRETVRGWAAWLTHRHVRVRFQEAGDGSPWREVQYDVTRGQYKSLKGMEIPQLVIVYDPLDPKLSAPFGDLPGSVFGILFGIGLVCLGYWMARGYRREAQYGPTGEPLPGRRLVFWVDGLLDRLLRPFLRGPR